MVIAACVMKNKISLEDVRKAIKHPVRKDSSVTPVLYSIDSIPRLRDGRIDKRELRNIFEKNISKCMSYVY
jgi:acyl-coenzyme A synthetase/AMP-(fatty) acid ligase